MTTKEPGRHFMLAFAPLYTFQVNPYTLNNLAFKSRSPQNHLSAARFLLLYVYLLKLLKLRAHQNAHRVGLPHTAGNKNQ